LTNLPADNLAFKIHLIILTIYYLTI
jgi:hypothetical protein